MILILVSAICFSSVQPAYALSGVNFSIEGSYYSPSLRTLNLVLKEQRYAIKQDPNFLLPGNVFSGSDEQFNRNIEMKGYKGGLAYGAVMEWNAFKRHSLLLSVNVWQQSIENNDIFPVPLRDFRRPHDAPRSARYDLQITQLWLGWRFDMINKKTKSGRNYRIFSNIELFGTSFVYFNMDTFLKVIAINDGLSFASVSSTETFGVGYTSRFGIGAETFITDWVSVTARSNIIVGKVRKLHIERYFAPGFPPIIDFQLPPAQQGVSLEPPEPPKKGDTIELGADISNSIQRDIFPSRDLSIELDGYEISIGLSFHF